MVIHTYLAGRSKAAEEITTHSAAKAVGSGGPPWQLASHTGRSGVDI